MSYRIQRSIDLDLSSDFLFHSAIVFHKRADFYGLVIFSPIAMFLVGWLESNDAFNTV